MSNDTLPKNTSQRGGKTIPQSRPVLIGSRKIELTQTDPVLRLRELCTQGKYKYNMAWDKFENGFMIQLRKFQNKIII